MASLRASAPLARPMPVTLAVVLSVLVIIENLVGPALPQGSGDDKVPTFIILLGVVLGLIGIAAAVGLWMLRRWGMILTIIVTAVNLLSAAPGVVFVSEAWIKTLAAVTVVVCIAIVVLVLRPEARRTYQ